MTNELILFMLPDTYKTAAFILSKWKNERESRLLLEENCREAFLCVWHFKEGRHRLCMGEMIYSEFLMRSFGKKLFHKTHI